MIPATGSTALAARTWPELDEAIGAWTATLNAEELLATLAAHGVPAGKIFTAADMLSDAHFAARDMIIRTADVCQPKGAPMLGVVPKFSRTPGGVAATGPSLGEHTRQVLAELAGIDDATWDHLAATGLVAGATDLDS
jgi:formyl-CoA transferase